LTVQSALASALEQTFKIDGVISLRASGASQLLARPASIGWFNRSHTAGLSIASLIRLEMIVASTLRAYRADDLSG
jgi:hypothetical protein